MRKIAIWISIGGLVGFFVLLVLSGFRPVGWPFVATIVLLSLSAKASGWILGYDYAKREPDIVRAGELVKEFPAKHFRTPFSQSE